MIYTTSWYDFHFNFVKVLMSKVLLFYSLIYQDGQFSLCMFPNKLVLIVNWCAKYVGDALVSHLTHFGIMVHFWLVYFGLEYAILGLSFGTSSLSINTFKNSRNRGACIGVWHPSNGTWGPSFGTYPWSIGEPKHRS